MSTSAPDSEASRVFVGGVPPGTDTDELQQIFEKHGNVLKVNVFKGFAFVQYSNPSEAEKAMQNENGTQFKVCRLLKTNGIHTKKFSQKIMHDNDKQNNVCIYFHLFT